MEYTQTNPIPMPPSGAFSSVRGTLETVFDWQYELRKKNLLSLYEKGKNLAWNASDVDWSIDVDIERLAHQRVQNGLGKVMNDVLQPPVKMDDETLMTMQ